MIFHSGIVLKVAKICGIPCPKTLLRKMGFTGLRKCAVVLLCVPSVAYKHDVAYDRTETDIFVESDKSKTPSLRSPDSKIKRNNVHRQLPINILSVEESESQLCDLDVNNLNHKYMGGVNVLNKSTLIIQTPALSNTKTVDIDRSENVDVIHSELELKGDSEKWRLECDLPVGLSSALQPYLKLSKIRLTGLVVMTVLGGNLMAPTAIVWTTFASIIVGTGLSSCSANSINQLLEIPYDSQMLRTRSRPLVCGSLTPLKSCLFATLSGVSGIATLYFLANPLTAALSLSSIVLYTAVYTPMKRYSIANTWVGSVVGALPPVMGWTAATGSVDLGGLVLGALLYAWQFPHFNSLSWNLKHDYSRAGYRMMSVTRPDLCKLVALRYSVAMIPLSASLSMLGTTNMFFPIYSLLPNVVLVYYSWQFYRRPTRKSARSLFLFTLIHLPLLFLVLFLCKTRPKPGKATKSPAISG